MVNIADAKSLTNGARRSFISAPAASSRIRRLEKDLAVKLLYRSVKGVRLTPAGEALVHHGRLVLQELDRLRADLQDYSQGVKGHVRICANTTALTEHLPHVLSKFLTAHPDVAIELRELTSYEIVHAVLQEKADIGIVASHVSVQGLEVFPYCLDRLVLAAPRDHALSRKRMVSFEETLGFEHVSLHEGTAIYAFLNQAAHELNKSFKVRILVTSFESMCRMIEANVGVGVLPESAARRYKKNMELHTSVLTDEWAAGRLQICVRTLKLLPAFSRELVDLLVKTGQVRGVV